MKKGWPQAFPLRHSSFSVLGFPLTSEQAIEVHVIALAITLEKLAVGALTREAQLLVECDSGHIVAEHRQLDAMQVQLSEGEVQRQAQRLGTVALAAPRCLANADTQPAALLIPQDSIELDNTDQLIAGIQPQPEQ